MANQVNFFFCIVVLSISGSLVAQAQYVPGEVLVGPRAGQGEAVLSRCAKRGLRLIERDAISGVLRLGVPEGSEKDWIRVLSSERDVVYAEPNGIGSGGVVPNDTNFGLQWHLQNTGQSGGVVGADIEAPAAWDITTGSTNIVIAVLDSGIDSDHPEFAGRIAANGYDFVNEDNDPEDDSGHGTRVAGAICANAGNSFGVTGVDWNCKILPIKVVNLLNGGTTMDLAQALNYVAGLPNVQVVSMSLVNYPNDVTLNAAILAASSSGKILISCAGNGAIGNADVSYPGASPLTISIGATTRTDARASFSATGAALDFVAPGESIVTVAFNTSADASTAVSGCSFATPIAAGVVGLILARAEQLGWPPLTQAEVLQLLQAGAEDGVGPPSQDTPGRDDFFGYGRINARRSLEAMPSLGACSNGNVGNGVGGPFDVLKINGLSKTGIDRRVVVGTNQTITFQVDAPPSNPQPSPAPAEFVIFGVLGTPTIADAFALPFGIGPMCFTPAPLFPQPDLFTLVNSFDPTQSLLPGSTAPWSMQLPGIPFPTAATLQGVIIDLPSNHLAITNAVLLDVRSLPAPTITSIVPATAAPGTTVTINGNNFISGLTLVVGGVTVTPNSTTASSIVFTAPAAMCGSMLTVTNPDTQAVSAAFNPPATIANLLTPAGTSAVGGKTVIVIGAGFLPGTTVTIGGNPMPITTITPAIIIGTSPPGVVGPQPLVVTTTAACVVTATYTYTP